MPHLWVKDRSGEWAVLPLAGADSFLLGVYPPRPAGRYPDAGQTNEGNGRRAGVLLLRSGDADEDVWTVISGSKEDVRINGLPMVLRIHTLADRDEIRVGGVGTVFFSTERLAQVEAFPGGDRPVYCARCKLEIPAGDLAVKCPGCGLWHCQNKRRQCWTYEPTCAMCAQPTDLNAGFQWSPADL